MKAPAISILLCTVRPDAGYLNRPDLHTIGTVVEDLAGQTFHDFELVVVDGLHGDMLVTEAEAILRGDDQPPRAPFPVTHIPPRDTLWTRNRKVAIGTFRNSGLVRARGELVVNLDDCCRLPPTYLEAFWTAYRKYGLCAAMTWPKQQDHRRPGVVSGPGQVYGFGSYPLQLALDIGGYDEAFDGSQALEDIDWSTRLYHAGLRQVLLDIPGFEILAQTGHDPRAIDPTDPIVKCCNAAWRTQRVLRDVRIANTADLWQDEKWIRSLITPCQHILPDGVTCMHHGQRCAYLERSWFEHGSPLAEQLYKEPPVVDLKQLRREAGL